MNIRLCSIMNLDETVMKKFVCYSNSLICVKLVVCV